MLNQIARYLSRIDEVRHPKSAAPFLLAAVDIDTDDLVGANEAQPLDNVETDAAEPEDDTIRTGLDLGRVDDCTDTGGDAAADVAGLIERRVLTNFRHRDLGQHGVVRERGTAHVVVNHLPA